MLQCCFAILDAEDTLLHKSAFAGNLSCARKSVATRSAIVCPTSVALYIKHLRMSTALTFASHDMLRMSCPQNSVHGSANCAGMDIGLWT